MTWLLHWTKESRHDSFDLSKPLAVIHTSVYVVYYISMVSDGMSIVGSHLSCLDAHSESSWRVVHWTAYQLSGDLGPLLFLLFINDLLDRISTKTRFFDDDCIVYRPIRTSEDSVILQQGSL